MEHINWGMIGCGNVTEKKSGPAFSKVPHSSLVAVMGRDAQKAADYAQRHGVPKWYNDVDELINDPDVNAIYIATPPNVHLEYAAKAMKAGKAVYVEKPMALSADECEQMNQISRETGVPLFVAQVAIEGLAQLRGRRVGRRHGNAQDGVGAQLGLGLCAIQVDHHAIEPRLVEGRKSDQVRAQGLVDITHGLEHAFAQVALRIAGIFSLQGTIQFLTDRQRFIHNSDNGPCIVTSATYKSFKKNVCLPLNRHRYLFQSKTHHAASDRHNRFGLRNLR